jgi:hypothetical protein
LVGGAVAMLRHPFVFRDTRLPDRKENQEMKIVRITVEGGVVQHVEVPDGVQVVVKDYDVDGTEADQLQQDENGDNFIESIWEHK